MITVLAYVYDTNGKLALAERPQPTAHPDSGVIKVNACAICGTDVRTYLKGSTKIVPPRTVGHEVVGTIVELGENISGFQVGDRVHVTPAIGCGTCYPCQKGFSNMCDQLQTIGFDFDGGFASHMELPAQAFRMGNITKLPSSISDEEGVLAEPCACVVNAQEFLNIRDGDYVGIWGSGFIGCVHAELAIEQGAARVLMIDPAPHRLATAAKLLPNVIMIDPAEPDVVEAVRRHTDGRGVDVAITACSAGPAQTEAQQAAAKRGRLSLFGGLVGESTGFVDSNLILYRELSVHGVHASTPEHNRKVLDRLHKGTLNLKKYISAVYPLSEIETAFAEIATGNIFKIIIKP